LLATLLVVAIATTIAQSTALVVAIVRPDGYLVPFAAYANGQWERAWPAADEGTEHPTFEDTPSVWRRHGQSTPRTWHLWSGSQTKSTQVRVSGIESVEAHCQAQVALKTDLRPIKIDHPAKRGVAVDSDIPLTAVEEVRQSDTLWKPAERAVATRLAELETQRARAGGMQIPRETPSPVVRITALYRESRSPPSPMYFLAEKPYRTSRVPSDPQCKAVTIMTGWLIHGDDDRLLVQTPRIFLTDCDGKGVRTAEPLAALHLSNRLFWLLQEHGYEDESYIVAEIAPSGVRYRVSINGGGC